MRATGRGRSVSTPPPGHCRSAVDLDALGLHRRLLRNHHLEDSVLAGGGDVLRVGRIGLYFQSDDTNITGWYNPDSGQYELLGNDHRNEIRKGMRISRQLIAPELILIPLPAAQDVGGA